MTGLTRAVGIVAPPETAARTLLLLFREPEGNTIISGQMRPNLAILAADNMRIAKGVLWGFVASWIAGSHTSAAGRHQGD